MTEGHLLSNGRYRVLITPSGAGYAALGDILLTRWSGDLTREAEGWFLYVRDLSSGDLWSAGHQPVRREPARYEFRAAPGLVSIVREDQGIELRTEIAVDPDADVEWRRHTLTNRSGRPRRLEVTSCAEVVLNPAMVDAGHPAFSKLFVQTEFLPESLGLLARRRPRSPDDVSLLMGAALLDGALGADRLEWETDRWRFIGRGRTLANPLALASSGPLSRTVGNVLDPILALRRIVQLEAGASVRLEGVLIAGTDRRAVENALAAARVPGASDRCFPHGKVPGPAMGIPKAAPHRSRPAPGVKAKASARERLRFFNGYGGFSAAGDEYVIRLDRSRDGLRRPPLPWANVVANRHTGFVASESGLGFTWSENSRQNRLTPWYNDPVSDPSGEALYIRDEAAGLFWSPTPSPVPGSGAYEARHGFGHTTWRHVSGDLEQDVLCFVPLDDTLKLIRLRITNRGSAPRRLSVYYYAEWVLGALRAGPESAVVTESVEAGDVLLAENPASADFGRRVAFAGVHGPGNEERHFSGDRAAFLGRYGSAEVPEGVASLETLDGRCGAGLDPCAAFQRTITLAPGATGEWTFLLGQSDTRDEALALTRRFAGAQAIQTAFEAVNVFWRELLSAVQVETPSPAMDVMVNGWLTYQNLSCRMWARSALYQSGGAFGFRDQLQDAAALLYHRPALTREQIVLHAGHQFVEGDVLHWWHPPPGRGIRTRFTDDLLWLPFVTEFYVAATGDSSLLEESAGFLTARQLQEGEDEVLLVPRDAGTRADVYEHCCRAIDRSLSRGTHGLPLMGTGDWNDGMNRVGRLGRGESIWLGFFLFKILERFIPLLRTRDAARIARYTRYRTELRVALNLAGWDGEWYRRAYYDDGAPLGGKESDECRIDALAQAWAILSGAAPTERAAQSLDAMDRYLVDESAGLIRLLTPPFDRTSHDPGYIKGYLPGVRENGGQYTHAALWAVRALAEAGRHHRAAHLFDLLNPVHHGDSPEAIEIYRAEPYVVAADVYGVAPHLGRGGWTWYTGSAGWMFRVALESILGLTLEGGRTLVLCPCIPMEWPGFSVRYRLPDGKTHYHISVRRCTGMTAARAPGLEVRVKDGAVRVELRSDGGTHKVKVDLGDDAGPRYRPSVGS